MECHLIVRLLRLIIKDEFSRPFSNQIPSPLFKPQELRLPNPIDFYTSPNDGAVTSIGDTVPLFGNAVDIGSQLSDSFPTWLFDSAFDPPAAELTPTPTINMDKSPAANSPDGKSHSTSPLQFSSVQSPDERLLSIPTNDLAGTSLLTPSRPLALQDILSPTLALSDQLVERHREKILSTLSSLPELEGSSYFSLQWLRRYYDNYWVFFHPQMPILHKSSSIVDKMPILLLTTILHVGMVWENQECSLLSRKIHDKIRWLLFDSEEFKPPAKLWVMQSMLVLEVFGKHFSTRTHHELAHIFHGTLITLMRRGTVLSTSHSSEKSVAGVDIEQQWARWIEIESTKRTAFFAFVIDSQHATSNGHTLIMSAHEIRLDLPCSERAWDSSSSHAWLRVQQQENKAPVPFLSALKLFLGQSDFVSTDYENKILQQLEPLSRFILLHGMFAISWHMPIA